MLTLVFPRATVTTRTLLVLQDSTESAIELEAAR